MKRNTKKPWCVRVLCACELLCVGCLLGIHRNVIRSGITGGRMPKAPDWHFWVT
jgi:hypothetical protein